jgi:hypothetical protein
METQKAQTSKIIIGIIIALVIIGGGIWFAVTNPAVAAELGLHHGGPTTGMASTTPTGRRGGMRGGFTTGSIEVLNDNGFTLSLTDGTTKNIVLTATSTLQNYASASSTPTTITSDQLSVGEMVQVIGATNADGSITARRVMTGTFPTMMRGAGGRMSGMSSSTPSGGYGGGYGGAGAGANTGGGSPNNSGGAPGMMTPPGNSST